ncbi:MAG: biotin--[acetyl-CoA-carboxylase] ligase [Thermoanaerobaculia bacterium]
MDFGRYLEDFRRQGRSQVDNLVLLERVDSTNLVARKIVAGCLAAGNPPPTTLVVALQQTHGRGRRGRYWSSPKAKGVYASWILPLSNRQQLVTLPLLVGVGLADGLSALLEEKCRLKWPNDLVVGDRKIGGILIESLAMGKDGVVAIIGFGVNHSQTRDELPVKAATSIEIETGGAPTLAELTGRLVEAVITELQHLGDMEAAVDRYRRRSVHHRGDHIRCQTAAGVVEGTFAGFDDRGFLRLQSESGDQVVVAGDLS